MKLTVLEWAADSLIGITGKVIETIFRIVLLILPLWVYLILIQKRSKVSSTSNLSIYLDDNSVWQRVYPGFILVALNKNQLNAFMYKLHSDLQSWVSSNKYWLTLLFGAAAVSVLVLIYLK